MMEGIGFEKNAYENLTFPESEWERVGQTGIHPTEDEKKTEKTGKIEDDKEEKKTGKVKPSECQTCKNRKYVDGSDEGNVSFKSPGHISPESSAALVSAHEQQHVANARREGSKENAQLLSATVQLKLAVCPECGTTYVAGGVTRTQIKYSESNPYEQKRKGLEGDVLRGLHIDETIGEKE